MKINNIGIIGNPLSHSLSPLMHSSAISHLKINYKFKKWELNIEDLENFFLSLNTNNIKGGCVTIPHKESILPFLTEMDEDVKIINACNWFKVIPAGIKGFNTDHIGFIKSLPKNLLVNIKNLNCVVFGAGGSSKSIVFGLIKNGCKNITIVNRSIENAQNIANKYPELNINSFNLGDSAACDFIKNADLIVNTTSLGMSSGPDPGNSILKESVLKKNVVGIDLVYSPLETPFLKLIKSLGGEIINGIPILINQAISGLEIITGERCPYSIMHNAIRTKLKTV